MSFSRWYPVSSFYYDPAIAPSKPMSNLAAKDDAAIRRVPKGRYDTTYRREYLNFNNGFKNDDPNMPLNSQMAQPLNPYSALPPIGTPFSQHQNMQQDQTPRYQQAQQNNQLTQSSIDHIITEPPNYPPPNQPEPYQSQDQSNDNYLPIDPIYLSPDEEQALITDVARELGGYSSTQLKNFYTEMLTYDPNLTGYVHYHYISVISMKHNLPINEPVMRFIMSRFVSPNQERGYVNYEELVKFLAKCLGDTSYNKPKPSLSSQQQSSSTQQYTQQQQQQQAAYASNFGDTSNRGDLATDKYDPDEQAILRLMHENMRDWDQINLIDCDNLRKKFYEIDPYNRYILTQREIEDVLYKNRIPIQRSLVFQILEKYCKVATGQYKWPALVHFLEKTYNLRLPNKKKANYTYREDEREVKSEKFTYRLSQLDALRSKASEEERIEEINKQIYNLQNLKYETKQRLESRMDNVRNQETWFTRFMRLANSLYNQRSNAGADFVLPKEEARRLITAYNTVYELNIPEQVIEEGLSRCSLKGNVVIDDLLKVLSRNSY